MSQRPNETATAYMHRIRRENDEAAAIHFAGESANAEARELWKRAACAALSALNLPVRKADAYTDPTLEHWTKDGAYSAAQTADALVMEFEKRRRSWLAPEPGRVYELPHDTVIEGRRRTWSVRGLEYADSFARGNVALVTWEEINRMSKTFGQ